MTRSSNTPQDHNGQKLHAESPLIFKPSLTQYDVSKLSGISIL